MERVRDREKEICGYGPHTHTRIHAHTLDTRVHTRVRGFLFIYRDELYTDGDGLD